MTEVADGASFLRGLSYVSLKGVFVQNRESTLVIKIGLVIVIGVNGFIKLE